MDDYIWWFIGATVAIYGGLALFCFLRKRAKTPDPYSKPENWGGH